MNKNITSIGPMNYDYDGSSGFDDNNHNREVASKKYSNNFPHHVTSQQQQQSEQKVMSETMTNHNTKNIISSSSSFSHVLLSFAKYKHSEDNVTDVIPSGNYDAGGEQQLDENQREPVTTSCQLSSSNNDVVVQKQMNNFARKSDDVSLNHQLLPISHPSIPPMIIGNTHQLVTSSSGVCHHQQSNTASSTSTLPTQQSTTNLPYVISKECCSQNLYPAPLPHNPIDEEWENSTPLEKEMAWLSEESDIIISPSSRNYAGSSQNNMTRLPILLGFAWTHGSLQLREQMWGRFPSMLISLLNNFNNRGGGSIAEQKITGVVAEEESGSPLAVIDGYELLRSSRHHHGSETRRSCCCCDDGEIIRRLRKEARHALQLGYRRSESIERELNVIQGLRWRTAVEENGDPVADEYWTAKPKQLRHRRKKRRLDKNEAMLKTALGQDCDSSSFSQSATELETIASLVPSELTPLEDEVAWLVEESLILLPDGMVNNNKNASSKQTESVISAGLVTKSADIKWDYVSQNASELLKDLFKRIGGIKRRPLQRIIRYTNREVKASFQKRRDDIASLLLLRGYRRDQTKHFLPSRELLVQTGLDKVWTVRLMRRRLNEKVDDTVSPRELRAACNARYGDKPHPAKKAQRPTKKKQISRKAASVKKPQPPGVAVRVGVAQDDTKASGDKPHPAKKTQRPTKKKRISNKAAPLQKSQPSKAAVRFAVPQKEHKTVLLKNSQTQEAAVRLGITQNDHATSPLNKLQPPQAVASLDVAQNGHATASFKKSQVPEPTVSWNKTQTLEPVVRLAASQKAQSSILTADEEELAWLREEYEFETGAKCYDWDYIEHNSSLPLLIQLAEKRCAPSSFPSVAGRSRLRTMARLDVPNIREAYDAKRVDIRHAMARCGFRRDRSKHLPEIPLAPESFYSPFVRKNGTSVVVVVRACDVVGCIGSVETAIICIDSDSDSDDEDDVKEDQLKENTFSPDNYAHDASGDVVGCGGAENEVICIDSDSDDDVKEHQSKENTSFSDNNARDVSGDASVDKKEDSNNATPPCFDIPSKDSCDDEGVSEEGKSVEDDGNTKEVGFI